VSVSGGPGFEVDDALDLGRHLDVALPLEEQVKDQTRPIAANFSVETNVLLVAFGGVAGGLGVAPFEFFKMTSSFSVKRLFVRDLKQAWYHRGVSGLGDTIDALGSSLSRLVADQGVRRVVTCGHSMGGYAAILFGHLLGAREIHSFSPQTFIGPWRRAQHWDWRWRPQISNLHGYDRAMRRWFDLRVFLRERRHVGAFTHIYYGNGNGLDRVHAERMASLPSVAVHRYDGVDHNLVRQMRDNGTLKEILTRALVEV
jgi:pimeloyl-ACP methyl ester carboxylesterase